MLSRREETVPKHLKVAINECSYLFDFIVWMKHVGMVMETECSVSILSHLVLHKPW